MQGGERAIGQPETAAHSGTIYLLVLLRVQRSGPSSTVLIPEGTVLPLSVAPLGDGPVPVRETQKNNRDTHRESLCDPQTKQGIVFHSSLALIPPTPCSDQDSRGFMLPSVLLGPHHASLPRELFGSTSGNAGGPLSLVLELESNLWSWRQAIMGSPCSRELPGTASTPGLQWDSLGLTPPSASLQTVGEDRERGAPRDGPPVLPPPPPFSSR